MNQLFNLCGDNLDDGCNMEDENANIHTNKLKKTENQINGGNACEVSIANDIELSGDATFKEN